MTRVALIPTGQLEHRSLPLALGRLFPNIGFYCLPRDRHIDGFTSTDVRLHHRPPQRDTNIRQLIAAMIGAVRPGGLGPPADFAILVEDLELVNDSHPNAVIELVREAVSGHIQDSFASANTRERVFREVKEKCSFHLFRPMTEAYFFGESAALTRAGCQRNPVLRDDRDWEEMEIADPDYLALPENVYNRNPFRIPDLPQHRSKHPKAYLKFLLNPALLEGERELLYRETRQGARALEELDWECVVQSGICRCPFLHAMIDDLSQALGVELPWLDLEHTSELTRFGTPQNRLLRNI